MVRRCRAPIRRYAALQLANTVYGGYFTSRLVSNIREDKGYTYSPRSGIEHPVAGSRLTIAADVATEVTGPALLEMMYELGRISLLPVGGPELDAARSYASGTLALSTATAAGLASTLSMLAGAGVGLEYLKEHPAALAKVTSEDVLEVASELFAPSHLVAVLLGDADRVRGPLGGTRRGQLDRAGVTPAGHPTPGRSARPAVRPAAGPVPFGRRPGCGRADGSRRRWPTPGRAGRS